MKEDIFATALQHHPASGVVRQKQTPNSTVAFQHTREDVYIDGLVEMVEAVNANHSEEMLLRLYQFMLLGHLQMGKFALLIEHEGTWVARAYSGISSAQAAALDVGTMAANIATAQSLPEHDFGHPLHGFAYVIPTVRRPGLGVPGQDQATTIALLILGYADERIYKDSNLLKFLNALTHMMNLAIYNRRLEASERAQQLLQKELALAATVQQGLYPTSLPNGDDSAVEAFASQLAHVTVSGDYYDFLDLGEECYLVCMADVSGKGFPAALLMSNFQATLRTLVSHVEDLKRIVLSLNRTLLESSRGDRFVTALVAIVDIKNRKLTYVNAGHPAGYLLQNGKIETLDSTTTILGMLAYLPVIEVRKVDLAESFTLLTYTDGLTETFNEAEQEYGDDRIAQILSALKTEDPLSKLHADILQDLDTFRQSRDLHDDITMFSLRKRA